MSVNKFVTDKNVQTLWDVISDENIFKYLNQNSQQEIYRLFMGNVKQFYDNERTKTNTLVEMNKKYVLVILNHIKKNYAQPQNQINKIKIYNDPLPQQQELITYEEIQNDRRSQFDRDLNRRQDEFENLMTIKAPPAPDFSDKMADGPIKDMDRILKEMQAKRNYEEQISRNFDTLAQADSWLTPQKTSLKEDKMVSPKKVSWNETNTIHNDEIEVREDSEDVDLFSKLKKVEKVVPLTSERNIENLHDKMDKIIDLLNMLVSQNK